MKEEVLTKIDNITKINDDIVRYAWGNSILKTWFITKNKHAFLPKCCKLLFILTGKYTNKAVLISNTYPQFGDIIYDTDGSKIEVNSVSWI